MKNTPLKQTAAFLCLAFVSGSFPAFAEDPSDLFRKGDFYGNARYRYEFVDQDGPAPVTQNAKASTLRTRLGFKTGSYKDFQAQMEADFVGQLGEENYNDGKNGKTTFPIIADPQTEEMNQFWVSWAGLPQTVIKAGHQTINLDNQRFIGSVNWRQNDQTFDAAAIDNKSIENLALTYTYIRAVNRIFGHDHPQGDWEGPAHITHATYAYAPWLNATGYGYWMDFNIAPASSNRTYGLRFTGEAPLNETTSFFYEAESAWQQDHGGNPANYSENYYHLAPGIKHGGLTLQGGYEVLGGDGTAAFQTPLATLHAFNGWADKFLTTPVGGLRDAYGRASYKISEAGIWLDNTILDIVYHDFDADSGGPGYGREWDYQISRSFKTEKETYPFKEWSVSLKYADFKNDDVAAFTDTQKFWLSLGTQF